MVQRLQICVISAPHPLWSGCVSCYDSSIPSVSGIVNRRIRVYMGDAKRQSGMYLLRRGKRRNRTESRINSTLYEKHFGIGDALISCIHGQFK